MKRALVQLAVAGLALSALGFQFTKANSSFTLANNPVAPRVTQALDESQRVFLKGNTHPLARPRFDRGAAAADLPMNRMLLVLKRSPEQESALRQLLDEQQDKSSHNYHKWLTPDEFGQRFGPADQDIQVTSAWLQQHGFHIGKVARGRTVIEFSGTASQVQEAFGTPIHKYVVKGQEHWANANDPQIPAALAPVVTGIVSLHNFERTPRIKRSPDRFTLDYTSGSKPHITGPDGTHFLGPGDYGVIYNINPLYNANPRIDGSGVTIAVVGRSDINSSDIFNFRNIFSLFPGQNQTIWDGPDPGDLGGNEEFEADLDNSWSAAVAPGANIVFVVSATTNTSDGVVLSELYIVDNNFADIMTESFGTCESFMGAGLTEAELIAQQAAAQGTTFVASAGDSGAAGCDDPNSAIESGGLSVSVPASTPFTVGVGGTQFNEGNNSSKYWNSNTEAFVTALSYIPEDVWNESCSSQCPAGFPPNLFATGGGLSNYTPQPAWQNNVRGIAADNHRHVPDVALTAAIHDPYLICAAGSCDQGFLFAVGGTSAAAPSFAGIMALVDQKMGGRQGLANYVLYQIARGENFASCNGSLGTLASSCVFNDVTIGRNGVPGETGYPNSALYASGPGHDMATGLGSVNVANLVKSWAATTFNSTSTTLSPASITGTHGQPVTLTISVTSPSGVIPSGNVSLISDISGPFGTGVQTINLCSSTSGCTLDTSGNLTTTTNLLPGGTNYHIKAHYAGNANLQPSDSAQTLVNITAEPSVTTLTVAGGFNPNNQNPTTLLSPISYGTFVYLRADVAGVSRMGVPTGSVNILDNGLYNGLSYQLNTERAAASPLGYYGFAPGAHSLTASYIQDNSFQASVSTPPFPFTVTQAVPSMTLSYTGATSGATLNATLLTSSGGNSPTGNVSFTIDGNPVGTPNGTIPVPAITNPLLFILFGAPPVKTGAQATAAWLDSTLPNGKHLLQATYTGDTNYVAANASFSFNLQPDFTLATDNNFIGITTPGQAGNMTATIGALDGFTGTVNFACTGLPAESSCTFNPSTLKGSGSTIMTLTTTPPKSARLKYPIPPWWTATGGAGIAGIFLLGVPSRQRRWPKFLAFLAMALFLVALGCGGGSSSSAPVVQHDPGTVPGTYNAYVVAASGSLVHRVPFQLVIQ
ncbi:MAG TPA: protease pro-enzyme activation domain-containing protein [Terriglobales bacterium]